MRSKIFFLLVFGLATQWCVAQCYFFNTYDYVQKYDAGTSIIQTHDGGFISVGSSDPPIFFGEVTYTVKTDSCGNVLWKLSNILSPGSGGEQPNVVFENSNNNIILFGQMHDPSESTGSSFILKLDANGDSLYHTVINHGIGVSDLCKTALKNNDNEYILGGYYNVVPPDKRVFLSKVDSLGNILWKYDYGDTVDGYRIKNIAKTQDGGYIIGGSLNYGPIGATQNLYLIKADSVGNKQWEKRYAATYYQGYVLSTSDGGYLLVGNHKPSNNIYWGYVGKTDSAGNVQWQKYFNQSDDPEVFTHSIQSNDGNYIIVGDILKSNGEIVAYIAKISQTNGDLIWKREYSYFGGQSHNYIEDVIITAEGDIAATGYVIPVGIPNSNGNDMFILKTDSCGYLENDSIDAQFTYEQTNLYEITFTNQSQHYCTPLWYFGDGDSLYSQSPIHTYSDTGTYTVTLIVRAGNSLDTITQQVVVSGTVGISQQSTDDSPQVSVFPNPATHEITIQSQKHHIEHITLYDITGKAQDIAIEARKEAAIIMNIHALTTGIYFCHITLANGQIVVKKVVKH